ncbi:sperm phosphodiesterase 5 [Strongylocentrotus purpuratus]|uniref:Phosphodiesterase n=1 Tax=Strongylocentrotus purpuratus TaxID=7668 RepID=Q3SBD3_STRPU|nr:sperm phosphodiesterase 5 [Strongylocentrotus purpuratus]AAZ22857.1 sperm phosphodiesterase 5 [Strongylocentrotus purpuratus]|eukprot:NP_001029121.1 sperm phosphodiesterase 5 [Strongylocentrotus purpuratus]
MATALNHVSREEVEKYLEANHDVATDIFVTKATPDMIDQWLSKHANSLHKHGEGSPQDVSSWPDVSMKLTEKGVFQSIRKSFNISGTKSLRNLLSPRRRKSTLKRNKSALRQLDEKELFMELIRDIADELDLNTLCHKILMNVSILTNGDRCSLFLARGTKDRRFLVSKLFDVNENSTVEDSLHSEEEEIHIPFGQGIAGHVAQTKETVNIKNAYEDKRFNPEVDKITGYKTHSIMCMPICNHDGEVVGVAQVINKITGSHEFAAKDEEAQVELRRIVSHEFNPADEEVFKNYLTFCGIGIMNAQLFEMSVNEYKRNQMLLQLARGIFEEQTSLDNVVHKIMRQAVSLLKCQRCMVFILETTEESYLPAQLRMAEGKRHSIAYQSSFDAPLNDVKNISFLKGFELTDEDTEKLKTIPHEMLKNSINATIARHVADSGETTNIADFTVQKQFKEISDVDPEFRIRSVLCQPIYNSEQKIIGVAQMINKACKQTFTDQDEHLFEAFAIFCGLGIHNTQMFENAMRLMAKQQVALDVLSYHATAQPDEVSKLKKSCVPSARELKLYEFSFSDFDLTEDQTLQGTLRMFIECNLIEKYHIPYDVLCRWTLSVRKNYRPVIYHNWRHAFNVAQTMFSIVMTGKLRKLLTDLEIFALIVACLCHDLDHRGTNNTFQVKTSSPLSLLYGTSTMEHHHFDHCIMILNSEGNNIFEFMSPDDYREAIRMLESAILSTDLAIYFKKRADFFKLVEKGEHTWDNEEKKGLLRGMLMTACDVSAIAKPWLVQQKVAELVFSEFFQQGDLEREKLKEEPMAMMDRKKKDELPKMQVGFIDGICMPVYKMFAELWPDLKPLESGTQLNRDNWQALSEGKEPNDWGSSPPSLQTSKQMESTILQNDRTQLDTLDEKPSLECIQKQEGSRSTGGGEPKKRGSQMSQQCKEALAAKKNKSSLCSVI